VATIAGIDEDHISDVCTPKKEAMRRSRERSGVMMWQVADV